MRHPRAGSVFRVVLCLLLLASLYLLSMATQHSDLFGRLHPWLLMVNSAALVALVVLIAYNLWRLIAQRRRGQAGSRLTVRLVTMFVVLAVVPVTVVYYFSVQFLDRGIDSWFDERTEQQAVEEALRLSQASFDMRKRELLDRTQRSALDLADVPDGLLPLTLERLRNQDGAAEITAMRSSGRIIATSARAPDAVILPHRPEDDVLLQVRMGRPYVGLDPIDDEGLHIRVLVPAPGALGTPDQRILQVLYPVSPRVNDLAERVQAAYARYQEVGYLSRPLKNTFTITLSLVLLLSLLFAVWSAFYAARRLVEPVRSLAEGTAAVAAGDYGRQLPPAGNDELGFLVRSFNDMSRRVAQARDEATRSQAQVEDQRAYLETVLARLSSGVLALDRAGNIRTCNRAADQILGMNLGSHDGKPLVMVVKRNPHLEPFAALVARRMHGQEAEWREQISLFGPQGRQMLTCSGATLPAAHGGGGHVIVFDDVTTLIQAQRDAAWGEVARRLAHEIKNPLTPIQLAAERLRRKLEPDLQGRDAEVLERSTQTIIQQVDAMKAMVNAFNEYARPPRLDLAMGDINGIVQQVADLYRGGDDGPRIELDLDGALPGILVDAGRIRQLLHNLIKNALEATSAGERCRLRLSTVHRQDERFNGIEIQVRDRGPGFSDDVAEHLFEPYVTTKVKGTGLGMPIVKKIVEEHNGSITAENLADGACVTVRLPMPELVAVERSAEGGQ
ncbi:ATP-binding protein [Aquisalimonas sp.]|uniref:sensor histidine kinase n=1 Tax=Aquisalimonas sp. TaxID=1872621 RepID=UPI0025BCCB3D|nr:ATP-binding protein [Aquisalimonas sp.]